MKYFYLLLIIVLTVSCSSDKGYYECGSKNEKEYYGTWNVKIQTRKTTNDTPVVLAEVAEVSLLDDGEGTDNNPITYGKIPMSSFVKQYLFCGNNNLLWYWSPDWECKSHIRFRINSVGGCDDKVLVFNVVEYSANKRVMQVVIPPNFKTEMNTNQTIEEWIWTR